MLTQSSIRIRDFGPQGANAPVGMLRVMRRRLPVGKLWIGTGERIT